MTFGPWGEAALGAREVLARATRRSAAGWREAVAAGVTDPAAPFRLGDLSRSQWFLWTGANLAAGERAGGGRASGRAFPSEGARARDDGGGPLPGVHDAQGEGSLAARDRRGGGLGAGAPAGGRALLDAAEALGRDAHQGRPVRLLPPGPTTRRVHRGAVLAAGSRPAAAARRHRGGRRPRARAPDRRGLLRPSTASPSPPPPSPRSTARRCATGGRWRSRSSTPASRA